MIKQLSKMFFVDLLEILVYYYNKQFKLFPKDRDGNIDNRSIHLKKEYDMFVRFDRVISILDRWVNSKGERRKINVNQHVFEFYELRKGE